MSTFTNTFGGSSISPADIAFASYNFSSNITLYWPAFSAGQTNIAARFMNLTAGTTGLSVSMPDALLVSVGYDVVIFNQGSNTFNVIDANGGAIATIAPGQTFYLLLNNNTTLGGGWQTVQFGVGTGSASAAALAGAGLVALGPLLNANYAATTITNPAVITASARAVLQVWTGGTGTVSLPSAASAGNGFFFPFSNQGSGTVSIVTNGSDLIDGASSSAFAQTLSGFIVCSGGAWYTVGKGSQTNFAVSVLNLNVAGNTDVTETSAQAQSIIQQYTGILTGNINVIVPSIAQIYFVYNNTTGPYSLTVKTTMGTGVAINQGSNSILYCDGTNVVNAFTSSFGGAISISSGSAGAPNLNFIGSSTTGIYSPAVNQLAITANGQEVTSFISDAGAVNYLQMEATATGNAPTISALGTDTNIGILLTPKGTGAVGIPSIVVLGGQIDGTTLGATTPATIKGTTITATTGFTGNLTGNASTVTTNANLTGPITSVGNTTSIANNVTLPGSPVTTTQSGTDNSTKIATTAQVHAAILATVTGALLNIQQFSSNGTYTPTTGTIKAYVRAKAGGGSGSCGTGLNSGGGGGGAFYLLVSNPTSQTITIGAGGTSVSVSGTGGNSGGTTSYGSIASATGGAGGNVTSNGTTNGGSATGGTENFNGEMGWAFSPSGAAMSCGGAPPFDGTAIFQVAASTGVNATCFGGGGTGSASGNTSGAGGNGYMEIWEFGL